MLRHAQISLCGKSNASKKRQCHFLQTKTMHNNFFNRIFSKKWGQALSWALRGHPHFFEKILLKKLLCIVCVCKKWHCRFFEVFDLPPDNTFANLCLLKITLYPRVLSLEQNYSIYYYLIIFFWIELPSKPRFV